MIYGGCGSQTAQLEDQQADMQAAFFHGSIQKKHAIQIMKEKGVDRLKHLVLAINKVVRGSHIILYNHLYICQGLTAIKEDQGEEDLGKRNTPKDLKPFQFN